MNREDFPMLKNNIIYFDNGATTFKPVSLIDTTDYYYKEICANAHRGDYEISYKVDTLYEETRKKVANFINAKREEIVFTSGATESLNMIANGFFAHILEPGDEILLTLSEHASNVLPWFRLSKMTGAIIKYIDLDSNLHVTMNNVISAITPRTNNFSSRRSEERRVGKEC